MDSDNNMFTVLPMNQRFDLKAGETYQGSITVVNPVDAKEDFSYKVSTAPYGVSNEAYDADLVTDTDRTAIAKWIKIEEPTGKVKPNDSKVINFTITVPENAPAGGQYAVLTVTSNDDNKESDGVTVQNIFEIASVIYGSVDGETVREGEIQENNVPGFVVSTPITLSARLTNTGNIHQDATFSIAVSDFFTGNVILPNAENSGEYTEVIMPDSVRVAEREVGNLPALGVVKVSQTIYYNGETSTVEKNVIICPIWFMILVAVTLIAIVVTVICLIRKHHKKKTGSDI